MGFCVCGGAQLACSFGASPSVLNVLPENRTTTTMPIATIMDNKPMVNIMSFGMCSSMANPQVVAATAANYGVLTPMPCIPVTTAPWVPGSPTVLIGGKPALNNSCKLMCNWAGNISIVMPGTQNIQVP